MQTKKTCLIIDDIHEIADEVANYFAQSNFSVSQAQTCDEALLFCRTIMPDVILLDADVPEMTGLEFLNRLRRTELGRKPVVLYCAANDDTKRMGQAIWEGASECLVKPFDEDLLAFKLRKSGAV